MAKRKNEKLTISENDKKLSREIQSLSESSGLPFDELFTVFQDACVELETKGVEENVEQLALNIVKNYKRKKTRPFEPKAKAIGIVGFIIGDSGLFDRIEMIRNIARKYIEKNGMEAAMSATPPLINGDGQVLDTRGKIFGRENPHYLEPLADNTRDAQRTLHLIARINSVEEWKYGTIQTNNYSLALGWSKVKFLKLCQTFGIVKENPEGVNGFKLNSSQAEDTMSIFKAVNEDIDIDKVFMDTITKEIIPVDEVEKQHEALKDVWDRIVFVRGIVGWGPNRDRVSPLGYISLGLLNPDTDAMVTVNVPEQVPLDFGEGSEIIVIGKTKRQDLLEQDEETGEKRYIKGEGAVVIDAVGIYPIKGLTTPSDIGKPDILADEKEINGWVE